MFKGTLSFRALSSKATMLGPLGVCASSSSVGASVTAALQFFAAAQCLLQETYPVQAEVKDESHFDFIIVGGGTGGAALATRLAENRQFQVLLVEAGSDPPDESIIPGFRVSMKGSPYDWNFTTVDNGYSSQSLAGRREMQVRGKMLGGSGSINDMVYARGHPTDYDEWAESLGDIWSWTNVLPYFMKTEHMTDEKIVTNSELMLYHGSGGEIEVSGSRKPTYPTAKLLEAFRELGLPIVDDMTYPYKIGAGRFSHTIRKGRRDSTLTGMLNKVTSANLHVLKDTLATKVLIENDTAVGVKILHEGKELHLYADKEVIVSAGTFSTPKLLMLSGVGPEKHLKELGIDVVKNLPVGDNLNDHAMVLYFAAVESGFCTSDESTQMFEVIQYLHDSSGPLSYSDSMGAYLPQNSDTPNVPYFAIYPTCIPQSQLTQELCLTVLGYTNKTCAQLVAENQQHDLLNIAVVLLKPESRGKVRLSSTDPLDDPIIHSGRFSDINDLEGYPAAIKKALSLVNTSYFKGKGARVIDLTPDSCKRLKDVELIRCQVREFAMSAWHAVGTAAMGRVVDAKLQVVGIDGLRVVDASVMPSVIRGNTNAPVVMIAEKAAEFIKMTHK